MFSMKEMVKEIAKASSLSEDDVNQKIEDKQLELSGLVSPEGAAYIVGKELGVSLLKEAPKRLLKIQNVVPGMRSVDVTGKVVRISERKDFERDGRIKGVINVTLGDETGTLKLSLWDEETELIEKIDMHENDVISIRNGYVKENGRGYIEIRLGRSGRIAKSDEKIQDVIGNRGDFSGGKPKSISDIREEENATVRGSLVQIFKRNPFYEVCPKCDSRLEKDGNGYKCKEHGAVEPKYNLILSGVIDDGSGNIRAVFFRSMAEKIFGAGIESLRKIASDNQDPSAVYDQIKPGKEFIISGRIKKNQFTEKMELVANSVEEVDPRKEAETIMHKIEALKNKNVK